MWLNEPSCLSLSPSLSLSLSLSLSNIYAWKTSYEKGGGRFNSQGEEGDVFVIAGGEEREYHYFLMGSD